MADLEAKILKQVEFYFSNSNLPNDKFLNGIAQKNDGWVPIETIASFKKMKEMTEDIAVVVAAIRKSKELLEVNEDGTQLKRKAALPENVDNTVQSIYIKGFDAEATMEDVNTFFAAHLQEKETILCTRLRRLKDKSFKGSVFVEFDSEATAKRVAGLSLKNAKGEDMVLSMKADYLQKKKDEYLERKASKKAGREGDDDSKKRPREGDDEDKPKEEFKRDIVPDAIIKVTNLPDECMREDIKMAFEGVGCSVQFVEFNRGNVCAYVRMTADADMKATGTAAKMVEAKTSIKDVVPELHVLEGEEETEYWNKIFENQLAKKSGRGGRGGRGGGGRGGGRGRGRGRGGGGRGGGKRQKVNV